MEVNALDQMETRALTRLMSTDKTAGLRPFLVIDTAGAVNTGAMVDLTSIADIARKQYL